MEAKKVGDVTRAVLAALDAEHAQTVSEIAKVAGLRHNSTRYALMALAKHVPEYVKMAEDTMPQMYFMDISADGITLDGLYEEYRKRVRDSLKKNPPPPPPPAHPLLEDKIKEAIAKTVQGAFPENIHVSVVFSGSVKILFGFVQ